MRARGGMVGGSWADLIDGFRGKTRVERAEVE